MHTHTPIYVCVSMSSQIYIYTNKYPIGIST